MLVAPGTWATCSTALSPQGPAAPRKTLGVPASGLPHAVPDGARTGEGACPSEEQLREVAGVPWGPRLQKWVTAGKKHG